MKEDSPKYPLIEAAIRRSPLSRSWTIAVAVGVLLLLLVLMAFLDGALDSLFEWNTLGPALLYIMFFAYILTVYPFMLRSRKQAIIAFKPLLSMEDDAFDKVVENSMKPSRRGEWTAIFLGILILGGVFFQPWTLNWTPGYFWLSVNEAINTTIGMSLIAWLIYDTFVGIVRVSKLSRQDLKLDILDTETLAPVAAWSLGISLVFVGIIILSILSEVTETTEIFSVWQDIMGYGFVIGVTLLIFFFSMWSVHRAMSDAKRSKLIPARKHLVEISRELEDREAKGQREGMVELASTITAWTAYETRIKEAPTRPFNASIVRTLLFSVLTPGLVYFIKILSQSGVLR